MDIDKIKKANAFVCIFSSFFANSIWRKYEKRHRNIKIFAQYDIHITLKRTYELVQLILIHIQLWFKNSRTDDGDNKIKYIKWKKQQQTNCIIHKVILFLSACLHILDDSIWIAQSIMCECVLYAYDSLCTCQRSLLSF